MLSCMNLRNTVVKTIFEQLRQCDVFRNVGFCIISYFCSIRQKSDTIKHKHRGNNNNKASAGEINTTDSYYSPPISG